LLFATDSGEEEEEEKKEEKKKKKKKKNPGRPPPTLPNPPVLALRPPAVALRPSLSRSLPHIRISPLLPHRSSLRLLPRFYRFILAFPPSQPACVW
jgi:hypothetical protein